MLSVQNGQDTYSLLCQSRVIVLISDIILKGAGEDYGMIIENPHQLFVFLLSSVRQSTERTTQIFQDFSKVAQHADVEEGSAKRATVRVPASGRKAR